MEPAAGRLLVATPLLEDPSFRRSVVLLLQVDAEDGALGLVLDRADGPELEEVLPGWGPLAASPPVVFVGGPVQREAALCLGHARPGAARVGAFSPVDGLPAGSVGTVDLEVAPADLADAVSEVRVFAGYAGWAAGQLEAEIDEGAWWVVDALPGDAFTADPAGLWSAVLRRQGAPLAFAAGYPADPTLN